MRGMPKHYRHLNQEERDRLAVWRGEGYSLRAIARRLHRDPATIVRELHRNCAPILKGAYMPHKAQERAFDRWRQTHQRERLADQETRTYVRAKLQTRWSPELISGRLKREYPNKRISHEAIYQWIYAEAPELGLFLARGRHRRRWRAYHRGQGGKFIIPARISIRERPVGANTRRQWGHWEADTMVDGYRRAGIQVLVERKARYAFMTKLVPLNAVAMRRALTKRMAVLPPRLRRTLTYDNGSENVGHERVNNVLGTRSYFCDPYQSWQRGTVENTIGVARRLLPKKTDLTRVSAQTIHLVEQWLNTRPRKCLNYRTPEEALRSTGVALAP
jgi:transposase, IS30 family